MGHSLNFYMPFKKIYPQPIAESKGSGEEEIEHFYFQLYHKTIL